MAKDKISVFVRCVKHKNVVQVNFTVINVSIVVHVRINEKIIMYLPSNPYLILFLKIIIEELYELNKIIHTYNL